MNISDERQTEKESVLSKFCWRSPESKLHMKALKQNKKSLTKKSKKKKRTVTPCLPTFFSVSTKRSVIRRLGNAELYEIQVTNSGIAQESSLVRSQTVHAAQKSETK